LTLYHFDYASRLRYASAQRQISLILAADLFASFAFIPLERISKKEFARRQMISLLRCAALPATSKIIL